MRALGAHPTADGTRFSVWSEGAEKLWLCLFDNKSEIETERLPMAREANGIWTIFVTDVGEGALYGYRADGPYNPEQGWWFDPDKLLLDPYACEINRNFVCDPRLALRRGESEDTAPFLPKGIVKSPSPITPPKPVCFKPGGLIYELQVRGFTILHPDIPVEQRGTIAALAHPSIIAHLKSLHVSAVELMPVHAWIDERHLPPLGLSNAWGYNPVSYFALDPRLAPGGINELRMTVDALHAAGIGVIVDVVYNHDGESDLLGPTLSLRGLDGRAYFRQDSNGQLINDTGCGNSINCNHHMVRRLILDSMRHLVLHAGVDGFRFDLTPALGRLPEGFNKDAPLLKEMLADPVLCERVLIAEPWDIGPGGYQLGQFRTPFLEWNDAYRDDVRRFWRGDEQMLGALATRLAGSSDIFRKDGASFSRTVNFIAAHDGFPLADLTAYADKHNEANGEQNRDGHSENLSWNHGVEGVSADPTVISARRRDIMAMLSTLFASRGTIQLTAGDEFGRTQQGNNNAYAQDNAITWVDWEGRDKALEAHSFELASLRADTPELNDTAFLSEDDVTWCRSDRQLMAESDWNDSSGETMAMVYQSGLAVLINRSWAEVTFLANADYVTVQPRSVVFHRG